MESKLIIDLQCYPVNELNADVFHLQILFALNIQIQKIYSYIHSNFYIREV